MGGALRVVLVLATVLALVSIGSVRAGQDNPWHVVQGVARPEATFTGQVPGLFGGGGLDVSADGAFVADIAGAPQDYPGCPNSNCEVFARADVAAGTSEPVGIAWDGTYTPSVIFPRPVISDDGNVLAFEQNYGGDPGVYVRDLRQPGAVRVDVTTDGTPLNDAGTEVATSGDGNVVVFASQATNANGDPGNCPQLGAEVSVDTG